MKKDGLLIETGFEPSTCFPVQLCNLLRSTVPSTPQSNDSFEPVSLGLITPEVCSDRGIRTVKRPSCKSFLCIGAHDSYRLSKISPYKKTNFQELHLPSSIHVPLS